MARRRGLAPPLVYGLEVVEGMTVLARDPAGAGRIVEVFGDLQAAECIAILVPGNAHRLDTYRTEAGGGSPRANGRELHRSLGDIVPETPSAVIVWLGYDCPRGLIAGARRHAALHGADNLRRLTHHLPSSTRITLIGHSYGSVVCALAADQARVSDIIALASPGLGVWRASELPTHARLWATRSAGDWVRFLPRGRLAGFGHARQPTSPSFGAAVFSSAGAAGHSGYYTPGSESVRNIARIVTGRYGDVTQPRSLTRVADGLFPTLDGRATMSSRGTAATAPSVEMADS